MSSSNTSEGSNKKRRFLTAEKKFQIYLETQTNDKPVGEILRREGLYSTDLARIRSQVKEGALQRLSAKPGRQQELVSTETYEATAVLTEGDERPYTREEAARRGFPIP